MPLYAATGDALLVVEGAPDAPEATDRLGDHDPECVAVHPDRPERAFVGTFDAGLFRTTDGGERFERVGADAIDPREDPATAERRGAGRGGVSVMSAAVNPRDPDEIWVGTEPSALFHSTDGGDSWERVEGLLDLDSVDEWAFPPRPYTHHVRWLEADPHDDGRLYVAIEAGALVVTPDRGATWRERPPGSRRDNHSMATHPDAPERVYSAAGDGYAESADAGADWAHPQSGLEHRYVWGLAVDPGDPDTALVSSAHGAGDAHGHGGVASAEAYVYRSTGDPAAREWERLDGRGLPMGEGVLRSVLAPGRGAGAFYALNNHGLYHTADAGDAWDRVDVPWPAPDAGRSGRGLAVV